MDSIIGKTISIISYAEIRYVGIIENFDGERKIISISDVRIFGTEDRILDPTRWILPSMEIIPHIELQGDSVKTLNIIDGSVNDIKPNLLPEMYQYLQPQQQQQQQHLPPQHFSPPLPQQQQQISTQSTSVQSQPAPAPAPAPSSAPTPTPAPAPTPAKPVQEPTPASIPIQASSKEEKIENKPIIKDVTKVSKQDTDFDFNSNNNKFQANELDKPKLEYSYNKKSSFFDDLSSSVGSETDKSKERMTWSQEKSLNEDTFGQASLGNRNHGGRGRGRGRGGRGRGRGRGRGGFNNGGFREGGRGNFNNNSNSRGGNGSFNNYNNSNSTNNNQPEWAF